MKPKISLAVLVIWIPLAWAGAYLLWTYTGTTREPVGGPAAWIAEMMTETGTVTEPIR